MSAAQRSLGQTAAISLIVTAAVASSTSGPLSKSLLEAGWSVGAVTALRTTLSALVLLPAASWITWKRGVHLRPIVPAVLVLGVLGTAGAVICYLNAVSRLSVGVAMMIMYTSPTLVLFWVWVRYGQRPDVRTALGAATAFVGLVLVVAAQGVDRPDPVGVLWAVGGALCLASYFVASDHSSAAAAPPVVLAGAGLSVAAMTVAALVMVGAMPLDRGADEVGLAGARVPALVPLVLLVLVSTVFVYVVSMAVVRVLGARLTSFIALAELVSAVFLAWVLLGETPRTVQLVGGGLIVCGVVLIRSSGSERVRRALKADERREPFVPDPS